MRNRRSSVEIRYPGGRQGRQWATEVRGWLVAPGIPTSDIVLSVGMDSPEQLRLALIPRLQDLQTQPRATVARSALNLYGQNLLSVHRLTENS